MLKEIFFRQFEIFQIYKGLYGKPLKRDWVARVDFPKQILLIIGGRCDRYFWDIRQKIYNKKKIYAFSVPANKTFWKRTVFVFTKSWSRDQVMQKAYCSGVRKFTLNWLLVQHY